MKRLYKRMGWAILLNVFLLLTFVFIFSGCTAFESSNEASVSFIITNSMAQKISSSASSRSASITDIPQELSENSYIDFELKGEYSDIKTIPVAEGASITFDGIPVGTSLYAEATAYQLSGDETTTVISKIILYTGKSEKITVNEGENILSISMKGTDSNSNDSGDSGNSGETGDSTTSGNSGNSGEIEIDSEELISLIYDSYSTTADTQPFDGFEPSKLFDNDNSTKWCLNVKTTDCVIDGGIEVIFHTENSSVITKYSLTTADDTYAYPNRNPTAWQILGSNSIDGPYTLIHKHTPTDSPSMPTADDTEQMFEVTSRTPYQYYKFIVTQLYGATDQWGGDYACIQLRALKFYGDDDL